MRVLVFSDAETLASGAAELIVQLMAAVSRSRVTLGLAGGTTPIRAYERLRGIEIDWGRVDAWMTDERWVPLDHEDSNAGMAAEALFAHVPAALHPVPFDEGRTPHGAAEAYEELLRTILPSEDGRVRPDVVLLGIGDDGHTASLFPGTAALDEQKRLYVANRVEAVVSWRMTATYPLLHAANNVVFLVAGAGKAEAIRRVIEDPGGENLPARRVMEGDAEVIWLLDQAAAEGLEATPMELV